MAASLQAEIPPLRYHLQRDTGLLFDVRTKGLAVALLRAKALVATAR